MSRDPIVRDPSADRKHNEVKEDAVGTGSLALCQLKRNTEHALLKTARDAKNKRFDDWIKTFEKASELLCKQLILLAPVEVVEEAK